ncbi:hypothetical protein HN51_029158 [Arachis hypogaea]
MHILGGGFFYRERFAVYRNGGAVPYMQTVSTTLTPCCCSILQTRGTLPCLLQHVPACCQGAACELHVRCVTTSQRVVRVLTHFCSTAVPHPPRVDRGLHIPIKHLTPQYSAKTPTHSP